MGETKIFPSPIFPVRAAAQIVSIVVSRTSSGTTISTFKLHENSPENIELFLRGDLFHEINSQLGRHPLIGNLFHHVLPFYWRDPYFHYIPDLHLPGCLHVGIPDRDVTFTTFFRS